MVDKDSKLVMPELRKFHIDFKTPPDWLPRSQPAVALSPGLGELTHGNKQGNRFGWNDGEIKDLGGVKCRFCGSNMFIIEETDNAFVFGCAYEGCPNNQDNWKDAGYYYRNAKKRMGKITENVFGESCPNDDFIPPDVIEYLRKNRGKFVKEEEELMKI